MADTKESKLDAARIGETPPDPEKGTPRRRSRRLLWIIIAILAGFVVYAYAFQTTEVDLGPLGDESRTESLFRVVRALGNPDLVAYAEDDTNTNLDYRIPCPEGGFTPGPSVGNGSGSITVSPACAGPGDEITVTGTGFPANSDVNVYFIPPSEVPLRLAQVRTSPQGTIEEVVELPERPSPEVQTIGILSRETVGSIFDPVYVLSSDISPEETELIEGFLEDGVIDSAELAQLPEDSLVLNVEEAIADGQVTESELREAGLQLRSPRWSVNAINTLEAIIETVFMALLATTVGTIIAIPLSFIAAKNLMRDVRIPALQVGLAMIGIPIGVVLGVLASNLTAIVIDAIPDSAWLLGVVTVALGWLTVRLLRMSVPMPGSQTSRSVRYTAGIGGGVAILLAGQSLARFAEVAGTWFAENLPSGLTFLGEFVATNGNILNVAFTLLAALAGAGILAFLGSRLGYAIGRRTSGPVKSGLTILAMAIAGALVALAVGQVIAWLYQVVDTTIRLWIPLTVGVLGGGLVAWRGLMKGQVSAGLNVYYASRTIANTLRSIEPLIMAIVFVIWVGLGPFAGALALSLHTIAALTKLYSEQVESIQDGPLEAVRATGATRLQTVVYGVIPQIVSPYVSFTMYRWDINVRLSTIIGFVGGGGIGLLLIQNIRLLEYRAAAAQILAITIVVASMDYLSSRLRERLI